MKFTRKHKLAILLGKKPLKPEPPVPMQMEEPAPIDAASQEPKKRVEWFNDPYLLSKRVATLTRQGFIDTAFDLISRHTGVSKF